MKQVAKYTRLDGTPLEVEYDTNDPCLSCGLPVGAASMGGTAICPACDCGQFRNGRKWTLAEAMLNSRFASDAQREHFRAQAAKNQR